MARPVHFEIHASDLKAIADFYSELFGWTLKQWGQEPYFMIDSGEGPGINGAVTQRRGPAPEKGAPVMGAVLTMGVGDVDETVAKALKLGATEAQPKMAIPGVGWAVSLHDPDGNVFSLFQEDEGAS